MRILHTSDWHLGRSLMGFDLHDPQQVFIDHIIEVVKREKVDVLLISGDIYDRAMPSLASIDLLSYALSALTKITKVVISSGNHDSARRLGFGKEIFENSNLYIKTTVDDITKPALIPYDGGQLAIYGIPYLDPYTTAGLLLERDADGKLPSASHHSVLDAAMKRITAHRKDVKANRTIVMSHAWYAGEEPLDSDKSDSDTNIGGLGQASLKLLNGFDYAALGHLHKPKIIEDHIRYSGSALPYSFSEKDVSKVSYIINIDNAGLRVEEPISSPVYKTMHVLEDTMENLLNSPKYKGLENQFVKIRLKDERPPINPKIALADRFGFIVEFLAESIELQTKNFEDIKLMSPEDLVGTFLTEIRNYSADAWEAKEIQAAIQRIQAGAPIENYEGDECTHDEEDAPEEVDA